MQELIEEIESFLKKHARPPVDPDEDPEILFSSPDAMELYLFKSRLEKGMKIDEISYPHSSWGSGGYSPYSDKEAHIWHDSILDKIKKLKTST
jgi:hypothetical protein